MSKMSELIKVFVYGTLKCGQPNHHWLTRTENGFAKFLGKGTTVERLPLVIGTRYNIPFLLNKRGTGHNVQGEIYEVDKKMFANLDVLEDYPQYYDREQQLITTTENKTIECWLYLLKNFPTQLLEKKHLEAYQNSQEQPYCESYLNSNVTDLKILPVPRNQKNT